MPELIQLSVTESKEKFQEIRLEDGRKIYIAQTEKKILFQ